MRAYLDKVYTYTPLNFFLKFVSTIKGECIKEHYIFYRLNNH